MKHVTQIAMMAAIIGLYSFTAHAQPLRGLGVAVGSASSQLSEPGISLDGGGQSLLIDFQVPTSNQISINTFIQVTPIDAGSIAAPPYIFDVDWTFTIIGVQGRYWAGSTFIGAQIANYSVNLQLTEQGSGIASSDSKSAIGFGLGAGWEGQSGLSLQVRFDQVDIEGSAFSKLDWLIGLRF
jgi:hypothetical protein